MHPGSTPLDALAVMREQDERQGVDPLSPSRVVELGAPAPPPLPLQMEQPDWREEQELARRRAAATRPVREPDPALHREDEQAKPARPTPRLNRVKQWRLVPDRETAA